MRDRVARSSHAIEAGWANQSQRGRLSGRTHPTGAELFTWEGVAQANSTVVLQTGDHRDRYLLVHANLLTRAFANSFVAGADPLPGPPDPANGSHLLRSYTGVDAQNSALLRGELFYTSLGWDGSSSPGQYQTFIHFKKRYEDDLDVSLYASKDTGALEIKNNSGTEYIGVVVVMVLPQLNALVPLL